MKKVYFKPLTERVFLEPAQMIAGSDRSQSGLPEMQEDIEKSSDQDDEGLGNGQDDGIRSKENYILWD